ncbi:MAG: 16S rRNA (guanine(527)-N(7))-methyltransferase RsmG [Alphaproteobacteria bacterium]|nr:16S rRNA (guanine(527)-N(7))-methyltransferase RsmG [Alphaproteobacteria bacterium]
MAVTAPLTPSGFAESTGVSRETLDRLQVYADLLIRWNARINLVAASTVNDLWRRHFLDSAQLAPLIAARQSALGRPPRIVDLGSGAGFPGMVLAILGCGDVALVESNRKKVAFLQTVARETATRVRVHASRIEECEALNADVVTSRALGPLKKVIEFARNSAAPGGIALLSRGKGWERELTRLPESLRLKLKPFPSRTDPDSVILELIDLRLENGLR